MPGYPQHKTLVQQIKDLDRRLTIAEARIAQTYTSGTGGASTPVWDINSIYNGSFEAGLAGWSRGYWNNAAAVGVLSAEQANPLDGSQSARIDEATSGGTQVWWRPSGGGAANSGIDVFPTAPGDTWRVSALIAASVAVTLHLRFMLGVAPLDVFSILNPNVQYIDVASVALVPGAAPVTLQGQAVIPAGSWNYIGFHAQPDGLAAAGTWWIDDVNMNRRLS